MGQGVVRKKINIGRKWGVIDKKRGSHNQFVHALDFIPESH